MRRLDIGRSARRDIDLILIESADRHGAAAAARYRSLIAAAFRSLQREPEPLSSRPAGVDDLRLFALRFVRDLPTDRRVRSPAHVVLYRFDADSLSILRLLHEAMDLPAHVARELPAGAP